MIGKPNHRVFVCLLLFVGCLPSSFGQMGEACSLLTRVEFHFKSYFDFYFEQTSTTTSGLLYDTIKGALKLCCPGAIIQFLPLSHTKESIQEIVTKVKGGDKSFHSQGIVKLYYPEFADEVTTDVYDGTTPFLRLSKTSGHAIIMVKPPPKERVFVGEIIVKSSAILMFLITFAWIIGILAWVTDHHYNPNEFPNPFYIGMFEGFWWSIVTMTTVGYGDKAPKGIVARILAILWIMMSTVFLALFTANATTILAISQAEEDHSITLGKRIGVLNSKHFIEVELNLGATLKNYNTTFNWLSAATQHKDVDRLVFPDYLDFLLFVKDWRYKDFVSDSFVLTNAVRFPFQIGVAMAANAKNLTNVEDRFLHCMREEIYSQEKRARKNFKLSMIKFTENTNTKNVQTALDNDNLLFISYYFLGTIAVLVSIGLSWDYWNYRKRKQSENPAQNGEIEVFDGSNPDFHDIPLNSQSGEFAQTQLHRSSPNLEHRMAIPLTKIHSEPASSSV